MYACIVAPCSRAMRMSIRPTYFLFAIRSGYLELLVSAVMVPVSTFHGTAAVSLVPLPSTVRIFLSDASM